MTGLLTIITLIIAQCLFGIDACTYLRPYLYRLYKDRDHFYTTSLDEAIQAISRYGYAWEYSPGRPASSDEDCQCPGVHFVPVYRLLNPMTGDHFYTTSSDEANGATQKYGYVQEGIAFYCALGAGQCGATNSLRRYLIGTDHFYTTDENEGNNAVARNGAKFEGLLCYIWPA